MNSLPFLLHHPTPVDIHFYWVQCQHTSNAPIKIRASSQLPGLSFFILFLFLTWHRGSLGSISYVIPAQPQIPTSVELDLQNTPQVLLFFFWLLSILTPFCLLSSGFCCFLFWLKCFWSAGELSWSFSILQS